MFIISFRNSFKLSCGNSVLAVWDVIHHQRKARPVYIYEGDSTLVASEWCAAPNSHLLLIVTKAFIATMDSYSFALIWVVIEADLDIGITSHFSFSSSPQGGNCVLKIAFVYILKAIYFSRTFRAYYI